MGKKKKKRSYGQGRLFLVGRIWHTAVCQNGHEKRESSGSESENEALKRLRSVLDLDDDGASEVEATVLRSAFREQLKKALDDGSLSETEKQKLDMMATNFGLVFGGCYSHVLASYERDSELSKFGPGAAHLHELLRHAIARGCGTFDFSVGDERYKREWCDSELTLYDHVSTATLRGVLTTTPLLAARGVMRWIKQTPAVWRAVRKARTLAASFGF